MSPNNAFSLVFVRGSPPFADNGRLPTLKSFQTSVNKGWWKDCFGLKKNLPSIPIPFDLLFDWFSFYIPVISYDTCYNITCHLLSLHSYRSWFYELNETTLERVGKKGTHEVRSSWPSRPRWCSCGNPISGGRRFSSRGTYLLWGSQM